VIFGLLAVTVAIYPALERAYRPPGPTRPFRLDRDPDGPVGGRLDDRPVEPVRVRTPVVTRRLRCWSAADGSCAMSTDLDVRNVTVRFGGICLERAGKRRDRVRQRGSITGLIGSNGAGKTTFFNACTGRNRPSSGTVKLGEHQLEGRAAPTGAPGLGRTFQRMSCSTVFRWLENVRTGVSAFFSSSRPLGQIYSTRKETQEIAKRSPRRWNDAE